MDKVNQVVYQFRIIKQFLVNNNNKKVAIGAYGHTPCAQSCNKLLLYLIVQLQNLALSIKLIVLSNDFILSLSVALT